MHRLLKYVVKLRRNAMYAIIFKIFNKRNIHIDVFYLACCGQTLIWWNKISNKLQQELANSLVQTSFRMLPFSPWNKKDDLEITCTILRYSIIHDGFRASRNQCYWTSYIRANLERIYRTERPSISLLLMWRLDIKCHIKLMSPYTLLCVYAHTYIYVSVLESRRWLTLRYYMLTRTSFRMLTICYCFIDMYDKYDWNYK